MLTYSVPNIQLRVRHCAGRCSLNLKSSGARCQRKRSLSSKYGKPAWCCNIASCVSLHLPAVQNELCAHTIPLKLQGMPKGGSRRVMNGLNLENVDCVTCMPHRKLGQSMNDIAYLLAGMPALVVVSARQDRLLHVDCRACRLTVASRQSSIDRVCLSSRQKWCQLRADAKISWRSGQPN